jgi:hypothetical protein
MKYIKLYEDYLDNSTRDHSGEKIEVVDSSDTRVRIENGKLVCGNVFYHGAMINDVTKEELPQYFSKKETRFEIKLKRLSGKVHEALFITPSFRESLAWAIANVGEEFKNKELPSNVVPSVYKVTLKPGILLEYKVITHFSYGDKERLESNGCCGSYGGVNQTSSSLHMSECGIINPSCILNWELVKGDDVVKGIYSDKYNDKHFNKNLTKDQFEKLMLSWNVERNDPRWNEYKDQFLNPWYKNNL